MLYVSCAYQASLNPFLRTVIILFYQAATITIHEILEIRFKLF